MKYADYLLSPARQKKRSAVLRRARERCEYLSITDGLTKERCCERADDVHHLTYSNVPKEPLSDLQAVCRYHHRLLHGRVSSEERRRAEEKQFRRWYG